MVFRHSKKGAILSLLEGSFFVTFFNFLEAFFIHFFDIKIDAFFDATFWNKFHEKRQVERDFLIDRDQSLGLGISA